MDGWGGRGWYINIDRNYGQFSVGITIIYHMNRWSLRLLYCWHQQHDKLSLLVIFKLFSSLLLWTININSLFIIQLHLVPLSLYGCVRTRGYCLVGWGQISYRFIIMDNKYELTVHLIAKRNILCPCHFTDVWEPEGIVYSCGGQIAAQGSPPGSSNSSC